MKSTKVFLFLPMAGEDDADDVDSVSLFLCLLKENRLTRTSGFGDNTGGLLILASENFNSKNALHFVILYYG